MLIISGISREHNRRSILTQLRQLRVPVRLKVRRSRLELNSMLWGDYWQPCRLFFDSDARLVQRLNRLKKAWLGVLRHPSDRLSQMDYCWRYFGLLHHAIRI